MTGMLPEPLAVLRAEFEAARARAHEVVRSAGDRSATRPAADQWSVAECIAHLSESTKRTLPNIEQALAAPNLPGMSPRWRPRRSFFGWLLSSTMEPPVRFKVKTTAPFMPRGVGTASDVLAEFDRQQDRVLAQLNACAVHDIARIWMRSPFDSRVKYDVYSAFRILVAHQRRHLWQAERALRSIAA